MTRELTITCPVCREDEHEITGWVSHDPGCWRTANGDGWPESWDVDFDEAQCPNAIPSETYDPSSPIHRIEDAFVQAYRGDRE